MYDIITLRGLTASGTHGVYAFEHVQAQPFVVDVAMWVDISHATRTDSIDKTVSYADVAADVTEVLEGPTVHLIETLADRIAQRVMEYPLVAGVQVVVHKPQAPLTQDFSDVSVTVRRGYIDQDYSLVDTPPEKPSDSGRGTPKPSEPQDAVQIDEAAAAAASPAKDPHAPHDPSAASATDDRLRAHADPSDASSANPAAADSSGVQPTPTLGALAERRAARLAESGVEQVDDLLGEPMGYVAPTALRAPVPFVLAFGGNTGNVPVTLRRALELLIDSPEVDIREVSPLLRTQAVVKPGMEPQDDHWNMVAMGTTTLRPHDLLALTSQIEDTLGRERPFPWAPRTIDIDIITMGNEAIDDDILQLPHPRAHSRAFVLLPWLLIDPDAELPGYGRASDLVIETTDRHGVRDIIDGWYENPENVIADSNAILDAPTQTPSHASTTHLTALDEAPAAVGADDNVTSAEVKGHSESARMPMGETETGIIADDEPHTLDAPAAEPHGDQEQHHATPVALAPQAAGQTAADSGAVRPARRNFAAEWDAFAKTVPIDELHLERPWHDEPTPQRAESSSPNPLVAGHTLTGPADVAATAAGQRAAGQTAAGPRVSGPPARLTPTAPAPAISEPVTSVPAAPEPTAPEPVEDASTLLTFITDLPADASSSNERTPVADPETRLYQAPSFDEALETEKPLTPHTGVSWIPVSSGGARPPVPRHRAGDAPQDEAPHGSQALPLPNWNFAQKQVTIIDSVDETDGDATSGAHSATAATANSPSTPNVGEGKEPGDITVDPHLPEGTQIGALDTGNTPTVTVSRRGIFRPTHTGAVPVVKRDS